MAWRQLANSSRVSNNAFEKQWLPQNFLRFPFVICGYMFLYFTGTSIGVCAAWNDRYMKSGVLESCADIMSIALLVNRCWNNNKWQPECNNFTLKHRWKYLLIVTATVLHLKTRHVLLFASNYMFSYMFSYMSVICSVICHKLLFLLQAMWYAII